MHITILYISKVAKKVNLKSSNHKKKKVCTYVW